MDTGRLYVRHETRIDKYAPGQDPAADEPQEVTYHSEWQDDTGAVVTDPKLLDRLNQQTAKE